MRASGIPQNSWVIRLFYFVLIGWWLSLLWSNLAWAVSLTIVGLPLAIWMFDRLPGLATLMKT